MNRRSFFQTMAMAGAVAGMAQEGNSQAQVEGGPSGKWPSWPYEEIRIPYRERAGKINWPNGGPLCVHVYVTAEWNSNRPLADPKARYKRDLSLESEQDQYTFTVGVWRAVKLLDEFDIKASIFPSSGMLEAYGDLFRELQSKGHEIVARSFDQGVPPPHLTPDAERTDVQRATRLVEQVTGQRPYGWISPGAKCSDKTPEYLADAGYKWFGDLKGDDLPYGIRTANGKKIVVVPHRTMTSNDYAIYPEIGPLKGFRSGRDALEFIKDFFDSYYELGRQEYPGALTYGIHPMRSCIPDRINVHRRALEYMKNFQDVWFARYVDMADHWLENFMDV